VTIAPASCAPAGNATNLRVYGQCVEVSVDPKPAKSFTFAPGVRPAGIVQTCIAEGAPHYLLPTTASGARVARMAQKSATDPMVRVRDVAPQLFDPLLACDDAVVVASAPAAEGRWSGLTRVAAAARGALDLFAPRVAYAGHGGLGTLPAIIDDALSLFGPVDQYTFFGDFEQDVVGQPPAAPSDGSLRGRWTIATLNPGAVTVQPSLGDIASKLLVINQGGGNAQQKDGVEVTALLDPTPKPAPPYPFEGTYTVGLRAVVATPRAFAAPFILQSSTGAELARFTLTDGANAQRGPITFTAGGQSVTAGEWRQNVSQTIQFTVDFATGTVRLQAGSTTSTAALPFAATDLAQARWSITGRDGQIIGMDDLVFTRLVNVSRP
jgi:hypothetical protein